MGMADPKIDALRELARRLRLDTIDVEDMTRFSDEDIRALDEAQSAAQSTADSLRDVIRDEADRRGRK